MNRTPDPEMIDEEDPEWTEQQIKNAKRMNDLPESLQNKLSALKNRRGRPKKATTKISTTIRLDPEIIEYFKTKGPGWQTMINDVLKNWLEHHQGYLNSVTGK